MNLRQLQQVKNRNQAKHDLTGKTVLLTGKIPNYSRKDLIKVIQERGGKVVSSMRATVDLIVYTREDTLKFKEAKMSAAVYSYTVEFITGSDFINNYIERN